MQPTQLNRPPAYPREPLTQIELQERHAQLEERHKSSLQRVETLVRDQQNVSAHLNGGIAEMKAKGSELNALEHAATQTGVLATISRLLSRRGEVLARRSISDALVQTHEKSVVDLRRAGALTDGLKRTAAELQREIDALHDERIIARQNLQLAAKRVMDLEEALDALDTSTQENREQREDALQFQERSVSADMALLQAHVDLCTDELTPAKALRDTVQTMHEEMARFVLNANQAVNGAGRKIQALGMAADAATVVVELQESMTQLDLAMTETTRYLTQADDLLTRVLPDLNARLAANADMRQLSFEGDLNNLSRSRARALADKALKHSAQAEVDAISDY